MRLFLGLPFAAFVTGMLFVVMYGLVRPGDVSDVPITSPPTISIFAERVDSKVERRAPKIEQLTEAPPPPVFTPVGPDRGERVVIPAPTPTPIVSGPFVGSAPAGPIAIATIAPQYPGRCQASGTEGYAVVRFDVTANGQVVNAEIVDRSHQCFERAALQAIRSWRYQPAVGQSGLTARGVTKRFSFDLNEA